MDVKNQVNPPKRGPNQDKLGNDRNRLFYKTGDSSMLFAKDITKNQSRALTGAIKELCRDLHVKLQGNFILTK